MSSDPQAPTRATVRVPFEAEVVMEFERFSGFLAEYSANLSLGGMFLTTRYLKPVGSELRFEVRLKDAAPLVRGRGVVAWTRWQDQGPRRPAGMGVRFVDLDPESRELIYRIVDERLKSGQVSEELALEAGALAGPEAAVSAAGLPDLEPPRRFELPPETAAPFEVAPPPESPAPVAPPPPDLSPPPLEEIVARAGRTAPPAPETGASRPSRAAAPLPAAPAPVAFAAARASSERRRRVPVWIGGLALLAASAVGILWWVDRRPDASPGAAVTASPSAAPAPAAPAPTPADASEAATPALAAPPTPPPAAAEAAPLTARFSALEKVTWEEGEGLTELILWLDGAIPEGSFERSRIEGKEPREVIKLRGAKGPVAAGRLEVDTPEVRRVRSGLHAAGASSELHVVLDLAAGARVLDARVEGRKLVLRVVFR